jgi:hypothetical protein
MRGGEPLRNQPRHTLPRDARGLAAPLKGGTPAPHERVVKGMETRRVPRQPVKPHLIPARPSVHQNPV